MLTKPRPITDTLRTRFVVTDPTWSATWRIERLRTPAAAEITKFVNENRRAIDRDLLNDPPAAPAGPEVLVYANRRAAVCPLPEGCDAGEPEAAQLVAQLGPWVDDTQKEQARALLAGVLPVLPMGARLELVLPKGGKIRVVLPENS